MKIYTKKGDGGETSLLGGSRVSKSSARISVCGDVDELNAAIGLVLAFASDGGLKNLLGDAQRTLFAIGAELATPPRPQRGKKPAKKEKTILSMDNVSALERYIDDADRRLPPLTEFILPGGTASSAALHVARAVARRAERNVVALSHATPVLPLIVVYLNRLSDMLFVAARMENSRADSPEVKWR